jgi:autotransporter-associated beta strand protein
VSNWGIEVIDALVTSSGGSVQLVGQGGGTGAGGANYGVFIWDAATVSAGGSGSVAVTGTGGGGTSSSDNVGVYLFRGSTITSGGGDVQVAGVEGIAGSQVAVRISGTITTAKNGGSVVIMGNSIVCDNSSLTSASNSNSVTIRPFTAGVGINLGAAGDPVGGPLSLSNTEVGTISAGTINIGDTNTGPFAVSDAISFAASSTTTVNLATGANNNIAFIGAGNLDASSGVVSLVTSSTGHGAIISGSATVDVKGANLRLSAGSGGLGTAGNPLVFLATNVTAMTGGSGNQFLSASGSTTIDATGLSASAGTIELDGGTFILGGSDRIADNTKLNVNGATFDISTFNETVAGITLAQGNITGTTGVLTSASTIQTQSGSISAALAGAVGLTQSTSGTTVLSGANTYSGITTISAGSLQIGNGGSTGSLGTGNVVDNGTLVFNRTVIYTLAKVISGSGGVTISKGQVNFTGANTYTGTTLISGGSLWLGFATTTGTLSPSSAIINNSLFGSQYKNILTQGVDFASVISGSGALMEASSSGGTIELNGLNTYTGSTIVNSGIIAFNSIKNVGDGASALGAPTSVASGRIKVGSIGIATPSTLAYTGDGDTTDRVIDLAANVGGGATLDQSGAGLLKFTSGLTATGASAKTLTLQGSTSGIGEIAGAIVDNSAVNTTSVFKTGTGTWTLSGASTYTGPTTVSAGTLLIDGSGSITSDVTVSSGATLGGSGTINSANTVTVNRGGHLAPGSVGPGILNSGSVTFASGAEFDVDLNGTIQGTNYDELNLAGGTASLGGAALNVNLGFTPAIGSVFTIIHATSGVSGTFNGFTEGRVFTATSGSFTGTFEITYRGGPDDTDVVLTVVNAPPTFVAGADVSVTDESGEQTILGWATAISAGPQSDLGQQVHFVIQANSNPSLFAALPAIDASGNLSFTPAPNVSGSAQIAIVLQDNGGTASGGNDTSTEQVFAITVAKPHPWHNAARPNDVDNDNSVAPKDALAVINYINSVGSGAVPAGSPVTLFYDASGDNFIAPNDALEIINYINAAGKGEGEAPAINEADGHLSADLLMLLALDAAPLSLRRR